MCGCRCIILYYKQRLQRYDPIIVINVTLAHANSYPSYAKQITVKFSL